MIVEQHNYELEFNEVDIVDMGIPLIDRIQPIENIDYLLERATAQDSLARASVSDTGLFAGAALNQFLDMRHQAILSHHRVLVLIEQLTQIKHPSVAESAEEILRLH